MNICDRDGAFQSATRALNGIARVSGQRYIVPMFETISDWVHNLEAAHGEAVIAHGGSQRVRLVPVPPEERAPILQEYVRVASSGRKHFPLPVGAGLADFARSAARYPVYRIEASTTLKSHHAGLEGGQLFEFWRLGFEAFEERVREHAPAVLRSALDAAVVAVADAVETFRVGDRERAQHDRVDQCEDCGRAADSERERQDGRGREDGRETELTDRVTDGADRVVHTDRLDGPDPPSVTA